MKHLHYQIPNNLSLLHDNLLQTVPSLAPTIGPDGEWYVVMQVERNDCNVWLTGPEDADDVAIGTVVQAHDHTKLQPNPSELRRTRIEEPLAVGRSSWTASLRIEFIGLIARNCCPTVGFGD